MDESAEVTGQDIASEESSLDVDSRSYAFMHVITTTVVLMTAVTGMIMWTVE